MLGLTTRLSHLQFSPGRIHLIPKNFTHIPVGDLKLRYLPLLKSKSRLNCTTSSLVYADGNGSGNGKGNGNGNDNWNGDEEHERKGEERPRSNMRGVDRDSDPRNVLTAVLTAPVSMSVKFFWQQFCELLGTVHVAVDSSIAAIKYSLIAFAVIFIYVFFTFF